MHLYFIKREPKPDHYNAPYHPHLICTRKDVAQWEAGWTGDRAWVWERDGAPGGSGWLLARWEGLDIDYGHVARGGVLPDGTRIGFRHQRPDEPWSLLSGAVWWSLQKMPAWLAGEGVVYPSDEFTQRSILTHHNWADEAKKRDSVPLAVRPSWWPEIEETETPEQLEGHNCRAGFAGMGV